MLNDLTCLSEVEEVVESTLESGESGEVGGVANRDARGAVGGECWDAADIFEDLTVGAGAKVAFDSANTTIVTGFDASCASNFTSKIGRDALFGGSGASGFGDNGGSE